MYCQDLMWKPPIQAGRYCESVAIDANNNIYFAGKAYADKGNYFGNNTIEPKIIKDGHNIYIAKTDAEYNLKWLKVIEAYNSNYINCRIDNENNIIVSGLYDKRIIIDSLDIQNKDESRGSGFVAKLDNDGKLKWFKRFKNDGWQIAIHDIAIDSLDNIYICGNYSSELFFYKDHTEIIDTSILREGYTSSFIAMYDSQGNLIRVHSLLNDIRCLSIH